MWWARRNAYGKNVIEEALATEVRYLQYLVLMVKTGIGRTQRATEYVYGKRVPGKASRHSSY